MQSGAEVHMQSPEGILDLDPGLAAGEAQASGMRRFTLHPSSTALVLVDLHYGTLTMPVQPYGAAQIIRNATAIGRGFEAVGAMIVLTHLACPRMSRPDEISGELSSMTCDLGPPGWSEFTPAVRSLRADLILAKRKWSAFEGTDLDSQLRRRRITTLVIAGLTTNIAVEFTARDAWQRNYAVIVAEDAVASIDSAFHRFSVERVLPQVATVCATAQILRACSRSAGRRDNVSHVRLPLRGISPVQSPVAPS
jgi:nicotinamidase-related amidase